MHDFFAQAGAFIGTLLHMLIDAVYAFFSSFGGAFQGFADGLGGSLGINHSFTHIVVFVIGLLIAIKGIRNLARKSFISGIILLVIGVSILSWIVG